MVKDDSIETSKPMVDFLLPLIKKLHAKLSGRHLRILDPFFSNGGVVKHWAEYPWIDFVHDPNMTLGGSFEVNNANLQRFRDLKCDVVVTNPPWSAGALVKGLSVLLGLDVPLVFLCPSRCKDTNSFNKAFHGLELSGQAKLPRTFRFEDQANMWDQGGLFWNCFRLPKDVQIDNTFGLPGNTVRVKELDKKQKNNRRKQERKRKKRLQARQQRRQTKIPRK